MTSKEPETPALSAPEIEKRLRSLDFRAAGLWVTASVLMLLLTAAVYAAALPQIESGEGSQMTVIALRSLIALVLLFIAFACYQQVMMERFRKGLATELHRLQIVEDRKDLLEKLSTVDQLTELYNRRYMDEHLPLECARADRGEYALTLLLIDLNHFKEINDQHGHAAGDEVLQEFSSALRRAIRAIDLPIRLGGDEFLVLLPECTSEQVPVIVERVRRGLGRYQRFPIDFAAGWAQRAPGENPEAVIARADEAMYRNKAKRHQRGDLLATT